MNWTKLAKKYFILKNRYLYYMFYRNYKLRPRGAYPSVGNFKKKHSDTDKVYYEVYPEKTSILKIPQHFIDITSSFIQNKLEAIEPPKYILKVRNGRIFSDFNSIIAILDEENKIIGDVSLDLFLTQSQSIEDSRIFKRKYFHNIRYFNGTVFHILAGGGSYNNYFHWLIDSLSRIHILKESGLFDQVDWFYVPTIQYDFQLDSLKALGIPENKIIESTKYPHIKAETLLSSNHSRSVHKHIHKWIIDFCVKTFPAKNEPKYKSKRYYISRKDANTRKIVNEDAVNELLKSYNVQSIMLSDLSFQEKIDLFAYADLIISLGAAGFVNIMFCREGTKVLELAGDQYVDFKFYYDIAMKRKLDYYHLIGKNIRKTVGNRAS
ncbi:MAG: glycosyltransferase family 61 protein [Chitinophagales bacterium]|nr:glycosyltransferase family 61 protein [Chitinophagales bacterium]